MTSNIKFEVLHPQQIPISPPLIVKTSHRCGDGLYLGEGVEEGVCVQWLASNLKSQGYQ